VWFSGLLKLKEDPEESPRAGRSLPCQDQASGPDGNQEAHDGKKGTQKAGEEKGTQKAGAEKGTQKAGLQVPELQLGLTGKDQKLVFVGGATGKVGSRARQVRLPVSSQGPQPGGAGGVLARLGHLA